MLLIASALHDIVHYLVSFARLGNSEASISSSGRPKGRPSPLSADWGGSEGIGRSTANKSALGRRHRVICVLCALAVAATELYELKEQIQRLSDPGSPDSVCRLLQLRREVLLLQFDTTVRHLGRFDLRLFFQRAVFIKRNSN